MLYPTAGSKIYIGGALPNLTGDDLVLADFNGQVWTEIKGTTNLGSAGDVSELLTSNVIGITRTRKRKGTRNAGTMETVSDLNYADAGQQALIAAEKQREPYAFKIEFNDAPAGGTPSIRLFAALVMSAREAWNEANSIMALNGALEIDSNIVAVAASMTGSVPDNTVLPAIDNLTPQVNDTLMTTDGTWTGDPAPQFTYQWFADGESIPGATANTYVVTAPDEGKVISVLVTASNFHGTAQAMSAATAAVAP